MNPEAQLPSTHAQLVETLGNLTYGGLFPDRTIPLTDGVAYYEEEGPGTPYVLLMDQIIATGDLDGNGVEDAAILLEDHSVGSGTFLLPGRGVGCSNRTYAAYGTDGR